MIPRMVSALLIALIASPAVADTIVAKRILRAQTIVTPDDIEIRPDNTEGAVSDPRDAIGSETRETVYQGQSLFSKDLGPPAIIDRNQRVTLLYRNGPLSIRTEGRSLSRGGVGDQIRVLNVSSKTTVTAVIDSDGIAVVDPGLR